MKTGMDSAPGYAGSTGLFLENERMSAGMTDYETSQRVLRELFERDYTFVLATCVENIPSQRVVDTCYWQGAFWIVTHGLSNKVRQLQENPRVSLCNGFHIFEGTAFNAGHPLLEQNREIRQKLTEVFAPWYFAHNDEADEQMCFVKVEPRTGFFHGNGTGYRVDFLARTAQLIPFSPQIQMMVD